jgi:predicted HicB family RNase H-like nuclease
MEEIKRFRYKTDPQTHALLKLIADLEGYSMEEYAVRAIKEKAAADAKKYPFITGEVLHEGAAV